MLNVKHRKEAPGDSDGKRGRVVGKLATPIYPTNLFPDERVALLVLRYTDMFPSSLEVFRNFTVKVVRTRILLPSTPIYRVLGT